MTKAPISTRALESDVTLSCGLLTIPIAIHTGKVSEHGVKRKMFSPAGNPIGFKKVDSVTGDEVAHAEIVMKIETEYGPVFVEDHEIERLFNLEAKTITVKAFQPQRLFYDGTYVAKTPLSISVPKKKVGTKKVANTKAEEALTVILAAMAAECAIAVVEFTTRGKPKPGVLLPDGTLWEVYHEDELRERRPMPEIDIPEVKLQAGVGFIKALWSEEPIDTTDVRSALIQAFADEKASAGDFDKADEPTLTLVEADAPDDLMALLAASVEAAKAA